MKLSQYHVTQVLGPKGRIKLPLDDPSGITFLDMGSGSGLILALLQAQFPSIHVVGMARDWEHLPFTELGAARGVITMDMDILRRLPFPDGTFDVLHSKWSGLRYITANTGREKPPLAEMQQNLRAALFEYDRLTRPGGFIVQWPWFVSRDVSDASTFIAILNSTAQLMEWETVALELAAAQGCAGPNKLLTMGKKKPISLYFAFRKPINRVLSQQALLPLPATADALGHICFGLNTSNLTSKQATPRF